LLNSSGGKKGGDEDEDDADLKKLRAGLTGMNLETDKCAKSALYCLIAYISTY
jgi:hypothetical protein